MKDRFKNLDFWSRVLLLKVYFDKGMSILNYFTKVALVIGIGAVIQDFSYKKVALMGVGYAVFAFIVGFLWLHFELMEREQELYNRVDPFQRQVREKLKIRKVYK